MKLAKKMAAVPLEYQASVYAKELKSLQSKSQEKKQKKLQELRTELKILKEKLHSAQSEEAHIQVKKDIQAKEQAIKRAPRPKRKWTPVLSGSFESGTK